MGALGWGPHRGVARVVPQHPWMGPRPWPAGLAQAGHWHWQGSVRLSPLAKAASLPCEPVRPLLAGPVTKVVARLRALLCPPQNLILALLVVAVVVAVVVVVAASGQPLVVAIAVAAAAAVVVLVVVVVVPGAPRHLEDLALVRVWPRVHMPC